MALPHIHLVAPAGSCRSFFANPQIQSMGRMCELIQEAIGPDYRLTFNPALFDVDEEAQTCGRRDDAARAADLTEALADDGTAAIVTLRGGAWLTRILPLIDFDVLDRRAQPVALFGFSEITTLVNIVAGYDQGIGIYDISPAFFPYALRRQGQALSAEGRLEDSSPKSWAKSRFLGAFCGFFRDVVSMIQGRGTARRVTLELVRGRLDDQAEVAFIGGNLTVFPALMCPRYERFADPGGCWIVLEDYNDRMSRHDRWLAHLTLADFWDRCEGILLGNFHEGGVKLTDAVADLLAFHLPPGWDKPVAVTDSIGHVWPMAPLPLRTAMRVYQTSGDRYDLRWPSDLPTWRRG